MLRATTACTFSTSQLPKVVRHWCVLYILTSKCASRHNGVHFFDISTSKSGPTWCVLYILTSKCASRHNGVQFFISHLASWLRTRRFSEPTFRPSGATNHWKNTVFRDFPTFSRICIFFLLTLSLLLFSLLIFLFSLPLPCSAFEGGCLKGPRLPRQQPRRPPRPLRPKRATGNSRMPYVPRLPRKVKVDVTKYQACQVKVDKL